jgi:tetratricopeptide (TPR) repeat protein
VSRLGSLGREAVLFYVMGWSEHGQAHDTFFVAVALEQQGDFESARGAYLSCMALRDPEWSPRAAVTLGEALFRRDDLEAALGILRAAEPNDSVWSARAKVIAGAVYARLGDLGAAEEAFRAAIASGHHDCAPMAWFNLGTLHQQAKAYHRALQAYEQALSSGHPEFAPRAAVNIGFVRFNCLGDVVGAEQALRTALASGHPQQAPLAAQNLAAIRDVLAKGGAQEHESFDDGVDVTDSRTPLKHRFWKSKEDK